MSNTYMYTYVIYIYRCVYIHRNQFYYDKKVKVINQGLVQHLVIMTRVICCVVYLNETRSLFISHVNGSRVLLNFSMTRLMP